MTSIKKFWTEINKNNIISPLNTTIWRNTALNIENASYTLHGMQQK